MFGRLAQYGLETDGSKGNDATDELARKGAVTSLHGRETYCGWTSPGTYGVYETKQEITTWEAWDTYGYCLQILQGKRGNHHSCSGLRLYRPRKLDEVFHCHTVHLPCAPSRFMANNIILLVASLLP